MRDIAINSSSLPGTTRSVRVADNAGRAFYMALKLLEQFQLGETGWQRLRIEIGCDQHEGVVVWRSRWRAGAHIDALLRCADAADIFVRRLAGFAFCERRDRRRDAKGDPGV